MKEKGQNFTPKRKKFADEWIKTGNATEAYQKAYSTKNMSHHAIQTEGNATLYLPCIQDYIKKRMNKIDEDENIPDQKEIMSFLGGVMRAKVKTTVVTKDGEIEVPPSWKERIDAAKELLKRFPKDDPVVQAQLRKLNAEATLAEQHTNESQDKTGKLKRFMSKQSDESLQKLIDKIESGDQS